MQKLDIADGLNLWKWQNVFDAEMTKADKKYIISDITGNGGGQEAYWKDSIVAPNIDGDLTKIMPKINQEDLAQMKYYGASTSSVEPSAPTKAFKGKIFLLVDDSTYSAAASFTYFCQKTGFATVIGQSSVRGYRGHEHYLLGAAQKRIGSEF